ncbi:hypothetical protein PoB_003128300 [Plakobranchus ocellatus]|uniref:Uncharacterized protein n=1 Tax=Plakobranchus ocellatus TaxID=259542 RepID=A0AAV4ABZ2_9GAST|nr:hypothetical protein PoB_003128300 [Plakobranchus ocellatus]
MLVEAVRKLEALLVLLSDVSLLYPQLILVSVYPSLKQCLVLTDMPLSFPPSLASCLSSRVTGSEAQVRPGVRSVPDPGLVRQPSSTLSCNSDLISHDCS